MAYDKPKVTIDLEEYNALLKLKNETYDPDEVATLTATIAYNMRAGGHFNIKNLQMEVCRNVDYLIEISENVTSNYTNPVVKARVIKKPLQ